MACTKSSYKGRYAFRATGFITIAGSPEPFAVVGHFKADGKGNSILAIETDANNVVTIRAERM